jgi:hypothetical protein
MTIEFDMVRYVQNVLDGYARQKKTAPTASLGRYIGALECCLCIVGVLKPNQPIPKQRVRCILWNWLFVVPSTRLETYSECMVRLAKEWLLKQGAKQ